jgi:hypothetical protein
MNIEEGWMVVEQEGGVVLGMPVQDVVQKNRVAYMAGKRPVYAVLGFAQNSERALMLVGLLKQVRRAWVKE